MVRPDDINGEGTIREGNMPSDTFRVTGRVVMAGSDEASSLRDMSTTTGMSRPGASPDNEKPCRAGGSRPL